ncbi:DUF4336 domain-containing protein [Nannocystis radixulma]|uniref:DUF4336 domain-containing protein n=1 Tax=Nannocystis radixulma TaxID=2995305 RepID=A0ABT5BQX4_9BACT|nr:DUF4336 domain-containing protein [Nannocystis radixulma]MDC0675397.1 DUF4336 domain-containing protein [Nannocystis radixulma]
MRRTVEFRALAADLWEAEEHVHWGLHVRRRMTIARLADGGLWLHSPLAIDDELAAAIDALGPVEHIVAPNRFHHLFAGPAKARYPRAVLWAAPGLPEKRRDVAFDRVLDESAPAWDGIEAVSLTGVPMIAEFVFFHRSSRTLVCTDALFNIQREASRLTRAFYRALGVWRRFGTSRVWRWSTRDHAALAAAVERVLAWDVARIVMAHGDVVTHVDRDRLRTALGGASGDVRRTARPPTPVN